MNVAPIINVHCLFSKRSVAKIQYNNNFVLKLIPSIDFVFALKIIILIFLLLSRYFLNQYYKLVVSEQ